MSTARTAPVGEFGDRKRAQMLADIVRDSPARAALFRRVFEGQASPRQAIKANCLQCCWMDIEAIRHCTSTECPLFDLRPFQKAVS